MTQEADDILFGDPDSDKIKAYLKLVKSSPKYQTITIHNGEKTLALNKATGYVFIINFLKGEYSLDFLDDKTVEALGRLKRFNLKVIDRDDPDDDSPAQISSIQDFKEMVKRRNLSEIIDEKDYDNNRT